MTGRDSNRGACAQPCRYQYALMEEKRPGEYFPVYEDEKGTYIMNSRDMCMIDHVAELIDGGAGLVEAGGPGQVGLLRRHRHRGLPPLPSTPRWQGSPWTRCGGTRWSTSATGTTPPASIYGQPGQFTEDSRYIRDWQVAAEVRIL